MSLKLVCRKCGIEKETTEFYAHKNCKTGFDKKCKSCVKKDRMRRYRKKKRKTRIMHDFEIVFNGRPDPDAFVAALKPVLAEIFPR